VFARINGEFVSQKFPLTTTPEQLAKYRQQLIVETQFRARTAPVARATGPTFADEARAYLEAVRHMPTYDKRAHHIGLWVAEFGDRQRPTITSAEIRTVLTRWRPDGHAKGGPLAVGSLNQRRTALMHLYTVLDGKSATNIVKDVPRYDESASVRARDVDMVTIARVIKSFRVTDKRGGKTRARLRVLHWTGWPMSLVVPIQPRDVNWRDGLVHVPARKKGKGFPSAWVPVMPRALAAFRHYFRVGAHQGKRPSNSAIHSRLQAHCEALGIEPFNPYALKHSFGTWAALRVQDNDALRDLLRTNSIERYIQGARAQRMIAARDRLVARPSRRAS
jgi:integrase